MKFTRQADGIFTRMISIAGVFSSVIQSTVVIGEPTDTAFGSSQPDIGYERTRELVAGYLAESRLFPSPVGIFPA